MNDDRGAVLLTGATGFVGMELLARYLQRSDRDVVAVVRAASDEAARARVGAVLTDSFGPQAASHGERVQAVAGELTAPRLGWARSRWHQIAERVTTIVHSAASVSFELPLARAREINVDGTRRMLALAREAAARGGLERYAHISTAYVAGTHTGRFREGDLECGQGFRNSYEQSKFEAERLVRAAPQVPFTILRPSIVVGDRHSGWTAAFNVLYWPLRAIARGLYTAVPANPTALVDVVSIDYVADAIYELCDGDAGIGDTYHLTEGEQASTVAEIAASASRYFHRPMPRVLSPPEFGALQRRGAGMPRSAFEGSRVFFPYFEVGTVFDDASARARLVPAGIQASPLRDYLERLLDFATASRWGKRPIPRADMVAA